MSIYSNIMLKVYIFIYNNIIKRKYNGERNMCKIIDICV